ncbi:hypothetical protein D3OALGA1CA_3730 [Olavius algarvensis associated proteobacterium Delta 3]|nr:hypothetical protein D3OALGA1CA_3730 [Olavius algarvensis associated proteobacterium Delta 3]CAB5149081.1 hypothetical protein D3OALGB2SA_4691 [Olavius algarvensis associated proteobacterium Delta 3]
MNSNSRHPRHDNWLRGYTHFLLFFVIFSFVLTYCILLGVGWGSIVGAMSRHVWEVVQGGTSNAPATTVLITEAAWLAAFGLIVHSLVALSYDRDTGYRLKYTIRTFVLRTAGLLLLMAGGFVTIRPFIRAV